MNRILGLSFSHPGCYHCDPPKITLQSKGLRSSPRNNSDKSSQRAMVIFMSEPRKEKSRNSRGSLIFFESTKIKRTTLSTTVAELYALMKCYGTCQMLRGLIKDITSHSCEIHMRTDANNLVTTASTTHVPEQQETIHMIQMLRKEACSGAIADLSHIRTQWCLADCLTKKSANPQALIDAVRQGILKEVDAHPPFRTFKLPKLQFHRIIYYLLA